MLCRTILINHLSGHLHQYYDTTPIYYFSIIDYVWYSQSVVYGIMYTGNWQLLDFDMLG